MRKIKQVIRPLVPQSLLQWRRDRVLERQAAKKDLEIVRHDLFLDLRRGTTVLRISTHHDIYLQHIIECFDYYVNSVIPLRVNGTTLVDMSGPRYHRLKGFADIPFLFPSHTEPYSTTAEYLDFAALRGGEIVLDLGAYSAVTSIIFARLVGAGGHVYAFEADETNYDCAQINVDMAARVMNLRNITLLRKAVWSHSDGLLFSNEGAMGSSAVSITGGRRGDERRVPSVRLQDFFVSQALDHADFVKMDIEGCEVEVLQSSVGFLRSTNARLIVEPHYVDGALSTDRCCDLLKSAGYQVRVRGKIGESEALIEAVP